MSVSQRQEDRGQRMEIFQGRRPLGIAALDELLHGGLPAGNTLLVQGAPGTGKTVLGLQFLYEGATRLEEPGFLVTFEEHPHRLYRDARALGWDIERLEREGRLLIVFTSPIVFLKELESDTYASLIRQHGLRRVVIDSLDHFETVPESNEDVRIRYIRVINALKRDDLNIFLTREMDTRETSQMRVMPEEYIADTLIQLEYCLINERRVRQLEIFKHRGSAHSAARHRFVIDMGGIQILSEVQGSG